MQRLLGIGIGMCVVLVLFGTVLFYDVPVTQARAPDEAEVAAGGFDCADVTQIPQVECEALVTFYYATGGDDWWNNENRLVTSTPCEWYGITCDAGHVTELDGYDNGLIGIIPPEMSALSHLRFLALGGGGGMSGIIPPELSSLGQLETFILYHDYDVSIPPELGNLTNLRELRITTVDPLNREIDWSATRGRVTLSSRPNWVTSRLSRRWLSAAAWVVQSRPNWAI